MGWAEDGAIKVFVEVSTTDTAPGDLDQNFTGCRGGFLNVFNTDIATVIKACCLHGMIHFPKLSLICSEPARWLTSQPTQV